MSNSYEFVNYTDIPSMNDPLTSILIRKHAMKRIGLTRRQRREQYKIITELSWVHGASNSGEPVQAIPVAQNGQAHLSAPLICRRRTLDDRALYDAFIRSLSCKSDPFNAASVSIDATARRLLQYFTYRASRYPNPWFVSSSPLLPSKKSEHTRSISSTIAAALRDDLLANCLLATAASRLYYVEGDAEPTLVEREVALTQEALRLAQSRLADGVASCTTREVETLVTCALHLGSAAFYRNDIATARLHIHAATTLAKRIGGVNAILDPYVRGRIISFDDLTSCIELRPCFVEVIYDSELSCPTSTSMHLVASEEVGGDSHDLLLKERSFFTYDLQELILEIIYCHRICSKISKAGCATSTDALAHWQWMTLRTLAIRNRLLAFNTSEPLADVTRVVLLMWTLLPRSDLKEGTIASAVAPKLMILLEKVLPIYWIGHEDLHLWCLLIGYTCAKASSVDLLWFAEQICILFEKPVVEVSFADGVLEGLVTFQRRFLFLDQVQRPITQHLADCLIGNQLPTRERAQG